MRLIQRQMSQLLIVDIQDKVLDRIQNKADIIKKASLLIQSAKALSIPIIVTEQYPKGLGHTSQKLTALLGAGHAVFETIHFSCMHNEKLRDLMESHRDNRRGQVILAGIEAHVSVAQSAIDLINDGYEVFVVADAMGSRVSGSLDLALRRLERAGAFLVDTEMVMFEWLEKAGTPEFKSLQALIK
jgi:nicotinamidase-related amidase